MRTMSAVEMVHFAKTDKLAVSASAVDPARHVWRVVILV